MAARDVVDGGRSRDYLHPVMREGGIVVRIIDAVSMLPVFRPRREGVPHLSWSKRRLLNRLCAAERQRVHDDDQFRTDY